MAQGEIGELLIKGPNITPGYWNKPEATAAAFTDGWLHTGDAARMDDEGFVYIVDRWKDMYISGGENVYPAEVENVLFQLPQVADAAIIGVPNERWGEVGMAIIVRKPDQALEEGDVIRHCLGRLAKFKVPQSVTFVDVLPRNATGKVLKRELRTQFVGADKPAISVEPDASVGPSDLDSSLLGERGRSLRTGIERLRCHDVPRSDCAPRTMVPSLPVGEVT